MRYTQKTILFCFEGKVNVMQIDVLHRFHLLATYCSDMCLEAGEPTRLGIIMRSAPLTAPNENGMYLALIDLRQQRCESLIVYSEAGPGLRGEKYAASDILLRYDAFRKRWVIAQLHNGHYVAVRTLSVEAAGKLTLSPLCLLDQEEDFERGFHPLLDLQINEKTYRMLTHRAARGHWSAPQVRKLDVVLGGTAWGTLREPAAIFVSGSDLPPLSPHEEAVILPEEAAFDPYLPDLTWNSAARLADHEALATAENAMVASLPHAQVLVLASPEQWVSVGEWKPQHTADQVEQWRVWMTGWDNSWSTMRWHYASRIGLPAPSLPAYEYPVWPAINVAMSEGPEQPEETVVILISMQDEEDQQIVSEGVCLKQGTGEVLQTCASPLGFAPSLCRCQEMMVGADLLNGQWRVWNWPVLQQSTLLHSKTLSSTCNSVSVFTMPANEGIFWLAEDRDEGLAVSQCDAHTLEVQGTSALIPDMHLLYTQQEERPLNGYRSPGLLAYRDALLLLLRTIDDEMILYQVR